MFPVARRAATAVLAGAALSLTLVFCSPAGAEPATTTSIEPASTPTTASPPTTTVARPAPPVTVPKPQRVVLIGTAASVQSSSVQSSSVQSSSVQSSAIQSAGVQTIGVQAVPAPRELPHTGNTSGPLALLGFSLVLLGSLALRGQHPQLRLSERS
jgi:LPXTG-motif cell wall-anchored protein